MLLPTDILFKYAGWPGGGLEGGPWHDEACTSLKFPVCVAHIMRGADCVRECVRVCVCA